MSEGDLYRAYAEDWHVTNATFDELCATVACQEFYLVIFSLQSAKGDDASPAKVRIAPELPSPSERFRLVYKN